MSVDTVPAKRLNFPMRFDSISTRTRRPKNLAEPFPMPVDALQYPRFAGISTFFRLPNIPDPNRLDVALLGIPFDGGTSYRTGPRMGPRHVRASIRHYPAVQSGAKGESLF